MIYNRRGLDSRHIGCKAFVCYAQQSFSFIHSFVGHKTLLLRLLYSSLARYSSSARHFDQAFVDVCQSFAIPGNSEAQASRRFTASWSATALVIMTLEFSELPYPIISNFILQTRSLRLGHNQKYRPWYAPVSGNCPTVVGRAAMGQPRPDPTQDIADRKSRGASSLPFQAILNIVFVQVFTASWQQ